MGLLDHLPLFLFSWSANTAWLFPGCLPSACRLFSFCFSLKACSCEALRVCHEIPNSRVSCWCLGKIIAGHQFREFNILREGMVTCRASDGSSAWAVSPIALKWCPNEYLSLFVIPYFQQLCIIVTADKMFVLVCNEIVSVLAVYYGGDVTPPPLWLPF